MTAIVGAISWNSEFVPVRACAAMLEALRPLGADRTDVRDDGMAAFGRGLKKLLPEDDFDFQPLLTEGRRLLIATDARLDNRAEIQARLELDPVAAAAMADSALLAGAWQKWGANALDRLLGDFALAVWESDDRSLTLARSAMALKPLFYHAGESFLAFASMPVGLHALDAVPKRMNWDHAAAVAALYSYLGSSTIFEGIKMVPHGHVVRLGRGTEHLRRYWQPRRSIIRYRRPSDYGDRLREELDRAVRAQVRRHHGGVAAQLSGGRDSSAVMSTAAQVLAGDGGELLALTAAPPEGFRGPAPADRLIDESALATETAALHPNVRHRIVRPKAGDWLSQISRLHRHHHGPLLNPTNLVWWQGMDEAAAGEGASVLLHATSGNFSISAGGIDQLRDMLVEDGPWPWLRTAGAIGGISPTRWRTIANISFGPDMPRSLYDALLKATGRALLSEVSVPVLRPPYRQSAERLLAETCGDPRPPESFSDYRLEMLVKRDNPETMTLGRWGIEPRDPTADRRLVEFCLSLPNEQLVSASSARPSFDAAFADRIPDAVLKNRWRGYQTPEWYEHFTGDEVRTAFAHYARNRNVRELFDINYIDTLIDRWPTSGWERRAVIATYRNTVMGALALANFIDLNFPD